LGERQRCVIYNLEEHPNNKYEKWVNHLKPICVGFQKFLDFVHPRIEHIKIDRWDTWNMDSTLAPIILPMLKQLREDKHGSGIVDIEDVPEHLRCNTTEDYGMNRSVLISTMNMKSKKVTVIFMLDGIGFSMK
jgi:hypothetical protein